HNGLIAAGYLAGAGLKTLVLERRDIAGGACVTEEIAGAPGFRVSTGAAQVGNLRPEIIRDLDLHAHGLEFITPDPLSVFPFPDGRYLALWTDPAKTRAEFAKFSEADAAALPAYMADCMAVCDVLEPLLYGDAVPDLAGVAAAFAAAGRAELFEPFVIGSMADVLDARFEADQTKAVLGYTATFGTNADPRTPGTAYVMAHHLFGGTVGVRGRAVYVLGGMGGLADALAASARHRGADIRTDADVAAIQMKAGRAVGVELENGETIAARAVVSNADPWRTFQGLVGAAHLDGAFVQSLQGIEMQGVALKVNAALSRLPKFAALPDDLTPARVSLCPSMAYVEAAWAEASRGLLSSAPYMTVHMQSAVDPSLVDGDGHTLTCYAQFFPYDLDPELGDWDSQREVAGRIVLDTVALFAPDLADCLIAHETLTPLDLERRFAMTGGHQFHGDLMPGRLFAERPAPGCAGARTPIDGLYLCGAGAHPGGCIWGTPGQGAARAVAADLGDG
ncbi:MAG: NAD(P)/FAD-dependent oxidoreductase, partial [Rhodospirillaceae bacterium]